MWLQCLSSAVQQRLHALARPLLSASLLWGFPVHEKSLYVGTMGEEVIRALAARRLRDERMVDLGVRMEDVKAGAGAGSVWKLENPALLRAEVRAVFHRDASAQK